MALAMNQVSALLNPNGVRRSGGGLGGLGVGLASHDPVASSPAQIAELAYAVIRPRPRSLPPLLQDLDRDQLAPMSRLDRVLRNTNARAVSRRGGILPAYATSTGGIPLPNPIRYDPMGYAYALGPQPSEAAVPEFRFGERSGGMSGLGFESETPEVRTLPWDVDRPQTKAEKTEQNWERAGMLIGVLGGALGIVLSYKALTGRD